MSSAGSLASWTITSAFLALVVPVSALNGYGTVRVEHRSSSLPLHIVNNRDVDQEFTWADDLISCSIEAAARSALTHPAGRVIFHADQKDAWYQKDAAVLAPLLHYIDYQDLNFDDVFADTPLAEWWSSGDWQRWNHAATTVNDAARLALIHKAGGMYLDSDIVLLDTDLFNASVHGLVSWADDGHGGTKLNNALFMFPQHSPFTKLWLDSFLELCPPDLYYGQCGPDLLATLYDRACSGEGHLSHLCHFIEHWSQDVTAPFSWTDAATTMSTSFPREQWDALRHSGLRGLHWYGRIVTQYATCISSTSPLAWAMLQGCPLVHAAYGPKMWCAEQ